jgi:uncharacterized protein (TIGR02421 family)
VSVRKFGTRGELRQKIGASGRAHLDRWLPFLVLNRSADPDNSIARRVAVNSPAYLVWSPEDDQAAAAALESIIAAMRRRLGPVLLVRVEDSPWGHQQEDAPELPPFAVKIGATGSDQARRALAALAAAVGELEVDLRRAAVQIQAVAGPPGAGEVTGVSEGDHLSIAIPQIHRGPDGHFYPQLTHELAVAFGDALLRAACAFMEAGRGGAPGHYRALGRSAFLPAARNADKKLDLIVRSFDFLLSLTPINTSEAMKLFIDGGAQRPPEFRYRPLTVDPDTAKRQLYQIDLTRLEDPTLERLLCEKRREIDYQLTMLATRNTPGFRPASQLLYGAVDARLLSDAHSILAATATGAQGGPAVGAEEVAAAARALVAAYRHVDDRFQATVEIRDDVAGLLVSGGKLMVASGIRVGKNRLAPLLAHEVSVHLLTYFNGATQRLTIFSTGLAQYEGVQEGLGVFAEWTVGGLTHGRLRLLAGRVVAVDAMLGGADFIETYRRLCRDFGFTGSSAFTIAMRVFRSGGFAKDSIYLKGFRQVVDLVASGVSLDAFWLGKIAPQHIDAVEELLLRELLHPPVFSPEFLARDDSQRRIARLRDGLSFDKLIELE